MTFSCCRRCTTTCGYARLSSSSSVAPAAEVRVQHGVAVREMERHHREPDVVGPELEIVHDRDVVGDQVAVTQHHALGPAGGARRVEQHGQVVASHRGDELRPVARGVVPRVCQAYPEMRSPNPRCRDKSRPASGNRPAAPRAAPATPDDRDRPRPVERRCAPPAGPGHWRVPARSAAPPRAALQVRRRRRPRTLDRCGTATPRGRPVPGRLRPTLPPPPPRRE